MYYIDDTIKIHKCFDLPSPPSSPDEAFSPILSRPYPLSEIEKIDSKNVFVRKVREKLMINTYNLIDSGLNKRL